jgi:hypothetical protein
LGLTDLGLTDFDLADSVLTTPFLPLFFPKWSSSLRTKSRSPGNRSSSSGLERKEEDG